MLKRKPVILMLLSIDFARGKVKLSLILFASISVPVFYFSTNYHKIMSLHGAYESLTVMLGFSFFSFILTYLMIPPTMEMTLKKNLFGVDINKIEDPSNKEDPDRKVVYV